MAVAITSDSSCDLFPNLYREREIDIVPLYITVEDKTYRDVFEITPDKLFESYRQTKRLAKTSAPTPSDFFMIFRKHVERGEEVVHLSMNSEFSSSYQNAAMAAREFDGKVRVLNTYTLSSALGLMLLDAADLRDAGASAQEIYDAMDREREKIRCYPLLDTLEFAHRGGRASVLQMFGANLLRLRPCLRVDNRGKLSVAKKFRGNYRQVVREYIRFILDMPNMDTRRVFVSCTSMEDSLYQEAQTMVRDTGRFEEVLTSRAGCSMSCHTGPNTFVVFYKEK